MANVYPPVRVGALNWSAQDFKRFRSDVSKLKKAGLIEHINASTAKPYDVRQGNRLIDTVRKFKDVLDDKVGVVELPAAKAKEYSKAGYKVTTVPEAGMIVPKGAKRKQLVLVPKGATEKVKRTHDNEVKVIHPSGFNRTKYAVPFHSLPQWIKDFKRAHRRIDATKGDRELFIYKFYGHNSYRAYGDASLLVDDLINGSISGPFDATGHSVPLLKRAKTMSRTEQEEFYQNMEILTIPRLAMLPEPPTRQRGRTSKKSRAKSRQKPGNKAKDAKLHKEWRASLTPVERAKYRKAAAKRAKKSRERS